MTRDIGRSIRLLPLLALCVGALTLCPTAAIGQVQQQQPQQTLPVRKKGPHLPDATEKAQIKAAIDDIRSVNPNLYGDWADHLQYMLDHDQLLVDDSLPNDVFAQGLGDGKIYVNPSFLSGIGSATNKWLTREKLAAALLHEYVHIAQYQIQYVWRLNYRDDMERLRQKEIAAYDQEIMYL